MFLYLCYGICFSKLSFFLLSLSMLQLCNHPFSLLMFKEELGIVTTSRCEQHMVQYFQEDTKTKFIFYNFFWTCGFSTFSIWVQVYDIFALTACKVHQCLDKAWWNDCVWWSDCCQRTRLIIFTRMQVHFSPRSPFFSLAAENKDEHWRSSLSFLFYFCALREMMTSQCFLLFFCFFLQLEKMTTSWGSSSSFFILFLCTKRR